MSDVMSRVVLSLDPALKRSGSSLEDLLIDYDLSPRGILCRPGSRLEWNTFAEILEDAHDRLGSLGAIEEVGYETLVWSWPAIAAVVSRYVTPFMAFQLGLRWFCPLIFRGIRGRLIEIPDGLVETVAIPRAWRDSREFFALSLGVMRRFPALIGWETAEAEFVHSDHHGEYRMKFRRLRDHERELRSGHADPDLERDLEELSLVAFDSEVPTAVDSGAIPDVAERLRKLMRTESLANSWTAADLARRIAMSERSLARRLASEGTTFRAVRDEVRCERAIARIREGYPISEVAYLVGFADAPSFHRAFRRWTGRSPGRFEGTDPSAMAGKAKSLARTDTLERPHHD